MNFRIFSDIHLDVDVGNKKSLWMPIELSNDKSTNLILAGDLWHGEKAFENKWIENICSKFWNVFIVLGNHDYWSEEFHSIAKKTKANVCHIPNCYVMEDDCINFSHTKIIGATLWTDFWNNPLSEEFARGNMNDYQYTKINDNGNYRKLRPSDTVIKHNKSKKFIFKNAVRDNPQQKIVVITHMAPSEQSLSINSYNNYRLDPAYCSRLDNEIIDNNNIDLWVHGHTHETKDYMIGNTRVYCNPRGYDGYENTYYSKESLITL